MPGSTRKRSARQGGPAQAHPDPTPAPGVRSVSFVSLGCPKNLVDSEKMLGLLAEQGLELVSCGGAAGEGDDFGGADAVVINTCGFLEASKEESLGVIHEAIAAKQRGEVKRVVVAGCLVQRHRAKMLDWAPGIDAMIGVFDRDKVVEAVRGPEMLADGGPGGTALGGTGLQTGAGGQRSRPGLDPAATPTYWIAGNALQAAKARGMDTVGLTVNGKDGKGLGYFEDDSARLRLTPRHYAYLRISEGCNQNCAFCTIPSIRGKMRSKPLDRLLAEARELVRDGAFELNLIGQDTTSYGDDIGLGMAAGGTARGRTDLGGTALESRARTGLETGATKAAPADPFRGGLPALLKAVSDLVQAEGGGGWIRLMYAYPSTFSDEMIDAFAQLCERGRLVPYLDMPLQHASDRVLAAMRRNVTSAQQERVIARLRERVPGMAVRTTFISGFPGETEDDHRRLLDFVGRVGFENVGVFEYSKEPGTPAGTMEEDPALAVPAEVKARRRGEVMELQQRIVFARHKALAERFDERNPRAGGPPWSDAPGGAVVDVLIDAPMRAAGRATTGVGKGGGLYAGRTSAQAPQIDGVTYVQSAERLAPGELVRCVITGWDGYDLVAKPASELEKRVGLRVIGAKKA